MNNHQSTIFHQIENCLKTPLTLLGVDLKNFQFNKICHFANHPYLYKGLYMKFSKIVTSILLLASSSAYAQSNYQWVQMVPNNQLSIRVVLLDDTQCPKVEVNSKSHLMTLRADKTADFPAVCELLVGRDTYSIKINQHSLPTLPSQIDRVAILGDTGCRIKNNSVQACNDIEAWPFRTLSASLAAKTADVVLHVGDYLYRESPCPEGNAGCKGSPSGYNWDTWNADWFAPANPLLQSAVMAFARGNHEDCNRAYNGWFRYLSPWAYQANAQSCTEMENPYILTLKGVNYIIFDSSYGKDSSTSDAQLALYKAAIKQLQLDKNLTYVLLTHRAMWTYNKMKSKYYYGNLTQQIAFKDLLPSNTLFMAGHAHYLQTLDMQSDYDQLVIGNGGTQLIKVGNTIQKSVDIDKHLANFVYSRSGFGYSILSNIDKKFRFYNQNGTHIGECVWLLDKQQSSLSCQ